MLVLFLVFLSFSRCFYSPWCSSRWIESPPYSVHNGPLPSAGLLPSVFHLLLVLLLMIWTPPILSCVHDGPLPSANPFLDVVHLISMLLLMNWVPHLSYFCDGPLLVLVLFLVLFISSWCYSSPWSSPNVFTIDPHLGGLNLLNFLWPLATALELGTMEFLLVIKPLNFYS